MRFRSLARQLDPYAYVLWAAAHTLVNARVFYGYMLKQTGGEWSAPLDDVFIHFDYARATALGHPFEWTVGNGYSSGNTSLTYPFVLAFGWLAGFTGRSLMVWAAVVATVSVFATLLAARRSFIEDHGDDWGRFSSYVLPPILLGVGALDWSLWSGMEVAFFLATWALSLVLWSRLERRAQPEQARKNATLLGLAGGLMVATRPEAALTIAVFGIAAAQTHLRFGRRHALALLVRVGLAPLFVLVGQSLVNRVLTGEASANGAIVKLALNNPYMTAAEKVDDWIGNTRYATLRNLEYHFAHVAGENMSALADSVEKLPGPLVYLAKTAWWAGVVPAAIAALPLLFARTRRIAVVLWSQIVAWILVVGLNGQVRWQNERYVMPAVAWMLILVALGVSVALRRRAGRSQRAPRPGFLPTVAVFALVVQTAGVLTRPAGSLPIFRLPWLLATAGGVLAYLVLRPRVVRAVVVLACVLFAYDHQIPKMRDQKWFFGRASRNIRDQHLTLGKYLKELEPRRVLVGDAGAILYESDRPGLDIIGLGGFRGLPFARAGVHGLPATLELIERIPERDRPDVLAIFPTWWGVLPLWFASDVLARFPVEGNVICGGYEHVVYRADWHLLGTGKELRTMPEGDRAVRAEIDVGDLVSERASAYEFARPANGWTEMRVLPDPADARADMFDGGRRIALGRHERFRARRLVSGARAHLVVRTAPEGSSRVRVKVGDQTIGALDLTRFEGWIEAAIAVPAEQVSSELDVRLENEGPADFVDYHAWVTQ